LGGTNKGFLAQNLLVEKLGGIFKEAKTPFITSALIPTHVHRLCPYPNHETEKIGDAPNSR
jgi:hypothetical protein